MLAAGWSCLFAQDASRLEKLEGENQELRRRLEALESLAQREGLLPAKEPAKPIAAMSAVTVSGYVQASYFHDSNQPADRKSDGYLWNTTHNSFSVNKVKLTLASPPVVRSGEKWDAGYRASLLWGEDAAVLNAGSPKSGFESLREAYVDVNVPVGDGLDIRVGEMITLLNWEAGDGGAVNPNFSQGYQWYYSGNGPSAGVQAGYAFTDRFGAKVRVQNGLYAGPMDSNNGKAVVASLEFKPAEGLWFNLVGWNDSNRSGDVRGGSLVGGYDLTASLHSGVEIDYFDFGSTTGKSAGLSSVGGWLWYEVAPRLQLALRAEYLDDPDGGGVKGLALRGDPLSAINSSDPGGHLGSLTLTLNWTPVARIKVSPEVRYDYTSYSGGFDGHQRRVIMGVGVNYLF